MTQPQENCNINFDYGLGKFIRALSNKKMFTKINPVESGYFWGKSCYFNEKSLKTGKSQIHNSFLLIYCNFIII